jgi:surface carbohydrate biosynthesis protein
MNIYIHLEIASRELDSKLLLAVLAASKGHQVVVSSLREITNGLKMGALKPGIFHTKSLTPGKVKIDIHQKIIDNGSKITSIDEEAGISFDGYEVMAITRYSDKTIAQSSAVFGWGLEDSDTLKSIYHLNLQKIHMTGSPRVDLWKTFFSDYWIKPKGMPSKPFLLVSSNLHSLDISLLHEQFKSLKSSGYMKRDPNVFKNLMYNQAESIKKLYEFIIAIEYLAKNNNGYDIVLRPHPTENVKAWENYLDGIPNVHVIRQDAITGWIKNSFATMHSGCTSAIEATISKKPVLTYNPLGLAHIENLANTLGYKINSKEELLKKTNELFDFYKDSNQKIIDGKIPQQLSKKIFTDESELAAEKILKIWESLDDGNLSHSNNWFKFHWICRILNFKRKIYNIFTKFFPNKLQPDKANYKFPPLDGEDIFLRIKRLQNLLGIKENLQCKLISKKTILIKKINNN